VRIAAGVGSRRCTCTVWCRNMEDLSVSVSRAISYGDWNAVNGVNSTVPRSGLDADSVVDSIVRATSIISLVVGASSVVRDGNRASRARVRSVDESSGSWVEAEVISIWRENTD